MAHLFLFSASHKSRNQIVDTDRSTGLGGSENKYSFKFIQDSVILCDGVAEDHFSFWLLGVANSQLLEPQPLFSCGFFVHHQSQLQ